MGEDGDTLVRPIGQDESVSGAIIFAVAAATGKAPVQMAGDELDELDELYNQVDPDALDALFREGDVDGNFVFYWEDCKIEIEGGTHVIVRELD